MRFTTDPEGVIRQWFEGAEAVFGWTPEEAVGKPVEVTFTAEDVARGEAAKERETAARDGRAPNVRWHVRKDGSRVFIDGVVRALRDPDGALEGFLKIGRDMSDRHRAEEHQRALVAELQHRVRNVLAMIRSVVRRTSPTSRNVPEFVQHLEGRIDAMARTQVLLTRSPQRVDLEEIIRDEMLAQTAQEPKYRVSGPSVSLAPNAAEVLTLALHELATNSVKYGVLGQEEGELRISWALREEEDRPWLSLTWRETGLSLDGEHRPGFGTELITRRIPYELGGRSDMAFDATALTVRVDFPLRDGHSMFETDVGMPAQEMA